MRARFVIVNAAVIALAIAAWRLGLFGAFSLLGGVEAAMLGALAVYFCIGLAAAWRGRWDSVRHVANALPALGLGFTGLGLLIAASGLHSLTPEALSAVFRALVLAISPNVVGVIGFAWLTAIAHWAAGEVV